MSKYILLLTVAPLSLSTAALADTATGSSATATENTASKTAPAAPQKEVFSTGVAKGRDILDAAISSSSLKETEIEKFGALSLGEVLRNIPGLRVEASAGVGEANITIRGLPLAQSGSKFMQLEEDGLPVLEFGDITYASPDMFLRTDLNLAAVEAIRGGSASTFASNSPGGVINLIDKTGTTDGGAIQASTGVNYGEYRTDFDYGQKLSDTLRFHVGGFYRQGEGPRNTGSNDSYMGGQVKFNITKSFDGGYIRLYAKYLDDRTPFYGQMPIAVSGTNANPTYSAVPGFNPQVDSLNSRNIVTTTTLNAANQPISVDEQAGNHAVEKSIGLEGNYTWGDWDFTDKFRFSAMSETADEQYGVPDMTMPAGNLAYYLGGPGATLSYATGPNAGGPVNPATVGGNGLLSAYMNMYTETPNLDNLTNDFRASRVWNIGGGELTTTAGFYKSRQTIAQNWLWNSMIMDVAGGGNGNLINITSAGGVPITQNGVYGYGGYFFGSAIRQSFDVNYNVNAPYGSVNFHSGKLSVGGSIRYDHVGVTGTRNLLGAPATEIYAMTGGTPPSPAACSAPLAPADCRVGYIAPGISPVNYSVGYVSYSAGVNYRITDDMSVFARNSKGGRAGADRLLFLYVNPQGQLSDPSTGVDYVHQTELGAKFRSGDFSAFVTGFLATATEHNFQISRDYRAYGVEFEGAWHHGPLNVTAGATWTHAKITYDEYNPSDVGNTPHHQPKLLFQATPQYEKGRFAIGTNIVGTTSSFADDTMSLKMPGYTVVSPFVQFRPQERLLVSLNCNNVFNVMGITEVEDGTMPASGVTQARVITGRTISAAVRLDF